MPYFKHTLYLFFIVNFVVAQIPKDPLLHADKQSQEVWVDSIYNTLTLKEKIGQLFTVQVYSNQDEKEKSDLIDLVTEYNIGGIIFSKGDPVSQAILDNELQRFSKIPLLVSMDAEWGLSMRLDSTFAFPWNMTLGAVKNNKLIEQTGRQIGEHCKRLGVHLNFAPVVDINTNPKNPIIGNRSFGEDKNNVTEKALAFMKGMQSVGVLANAKHFPGHGDTETDSHETLPTINFDSKRIDSVEMYPYKRLIKDGISSIMVAHLNVPSLETRSDYPSSLSNHIISDILKDSLGFKGLVISDALTMKGAADFAESGEIDLAAFMAGNDILLMSEDPKIGINKIMDAYYEGKISEERLEHSVKKILKAKYKVGLNQYKPIELNHLVEDLNRIKDDVLYEDIMEDAITVVKNKSNLLPLKRLETKTIAYVKMGDDNGSFFLDELKKYTKVHEVKADKLDELLTQLKPYNTIIIGFHRSNQNPWKSYEFSDQELVWLYEIARMHTVILDVFVKPYVLSDLHTIENIESIVVSYQNSEIAQQKSAQLIFGAIPSKGSLPVSVGEFFKAGDGILNNSIKRLSYTIPERAGMNSKKLEKIDSVAKYAIKNKMTPGIIDCKKRKGYL